MPGGASGCPSARRARRSRCPSARASSPRTCASRCSRLRPAHRPCCSSANWDPGARPMRATCIRSPRAPPSRSTWWLRRVSGADPAAALFGSERDGKVEQGALEQAAGGTLYLNGLEDLTSEAQRALIGAIEQSGYTRVGGRERLPLNVRWISSAQEGFEGARLARTVSPRSHRASERHHPAGAAAARLRRGRARPAALLR